jgi:hypothetical protein
MNTRYAALAYGDDDVLFRRAMMLFISLAAYAPSPAEFVILTDNPDRFDLFAGAIRVDVVTSSQLVSWRGQNPYSIRQKIEAARHLVASNGALVMLDVDVLASRPLNSMIAALHKGTLFMHKREYELGSSRRPGNRRLWDDLNGRKFGGWQFRPSDGMWNSGVIGITDRDAALLDSALALYDSLGSAGVRHFMIEQLAVGAVLERTGRLAAADDYFVHYWGNKARFDEQIAQRLSQVRDAGWSLKQAAESYQGMPIDLPVEVRTRPLQKLARWLSR